MWLVIERSSDSYDILCDGYGVLYDLASYDDVRAEMMARGVASWTLEEEDGYRVERTD